MSLLRIAFLCLALTLCSLAEHKIEHGGRTLLTFEAPQVDYKATKTGKYTRTFFSRKVGEGNLKITVKTKGWMGDLKAEKRFQDDRRDKRRSQHARLGDTPEIPGALRTLTYTLSSPYEGRALVVYTKDFRCELLVTGTKEAGKEIDPTFEELLKTVQVVQRSKIGELQVGK